MGFINRLIRKISKSKSIDDATTPTFATEDEYYHWFFTQNESWNKVNPNEDEQLRWNGIMQFVEEVKNKLGHPMEILDLGCGRGWLTNLLSNYGTIKGIEPVAAVVQYANKIFPHLNIVAGDSSVLLNSGDAGKFDLVVSSEVLEHVAHDEKGKFASNIKQLLKNEGYLIISTPRKEVQIEYCELSNLSQPVEEWLLESDVKQLFIRNSFEVVDFTRLSRNTNVNNKFLEIYQLWLFKKISS